ncbi:immunity 8 family protein [Archangium gephyra]|uniref:Imm8 family immunity protein n=1 Tax=Archangium gephyra TaxID=48 RepID=UPI0035D4EF74
MTSKPVELEIRSWSSPDVDFKAWRPDDRSDVFFLLEMEIGVAGEAGMDVFQVVVSTPEGLRARSSKPVVRERATLILADYSWDLLRRTCVEIVARCAAASWEESVLRLQRYFMWEYEDYSVS